MSRFVALLATLGIALTVVGIAAPAGAHTPGVDKVCGSLSVNMQSYNTTHANHIKVTIDSAVVEDTNFGASFVKTYGVSKTATHTYEVRVVAWDDVDTDGDGNGPNGWTKKFTGSIPSCQTPPPVTPTIVPTTPDCTQQNMVVTPVNQTGVTWTPAGATTLTPGQSVTYVATPTNPNMPFPQGTQTSWSVTNTLNPATCTIKVTPVSPTVVSVPPSCSSPNMIVSPSIQPGVIWSPSGNTTLTPGQSVTYVASPDVVHGYSFPAGVQTSWSYANTFDVASCNPGVFEPHGKVKVNCDGSVVFKLNNTVSDFPATYELRVGKKGGYKTVPAGVKKTVIMHGQPGDKVSLWGPADTILDVAVVPLPCPIRAPIGDLRVSCKGQVAFDLDNRLSNRPVTYKLQAGSRTKFVTVGAGKTRYIVWDTANNVGVKLSSRGHVLDQDKVPGACTKPPTGERNITFHPRKQVVRDFSASRRSVYRLV